VSAREIGMGVAIAMFTGLLLFLMWLGSAPVCAS